MESIIKDIEYFSKYCDRSEIKVQLSKKVFSSIEGDKINGVRIECCDNLQDEHYIVTKA